ncbi:MAG: hypothetical protein ABJL44_08360 [Algibacter sp.]
MNNNDFTSILQQPEAVTPQQTDDLKSIVDEFPYFQSARAIYLKGLKNQESFKYNQALKTTAAYTTDRSILFDFITSEGFLQNQISQFIKQNTSHLKDIDVNIEDISIDRKITIDDTLKQQIKDTSGVLDPALFQPKTERPKKDSNFILDESETIEPATETNKTQEATSTDILNLGKPLQFGKRETHSFNEWLKLAKLNPIKREEIAKTELKPSTETKTEHQQKREDKFKLIEDFIINKPKINPTKPTTSKGNIAKAQMIQPEALMTETLARIYVEQKNYKKAIQSYKILSLKYPKKSSFFAIQIKAVELLQEQNNQE